MKHFIVLISILAIFNAKASFAQTDSLMNKEVEVIKSYQPSINAAQKISENPKIIDTINYSPSFDYKIFSTTVPVEKSISQLPAVKLGTPPKYTSNTGYAKLAIGNAYSPYAEVFVNNSVSKKTDFGMQLLHFSSRPNIKLEDNLKIKAPFNDNLFKMFTKSTFRKTVLDWDLGFQRKGFRYYGFPGDSALYHSITPDSLVGETDAQGINTAFTNFKLKNINSNSKLGYNLNLAYDYLWLATGQKEHNTVLSGTFDFDNRKTIIVTDARIEYHYTDSIYNHYDSSKDNHQFVNVHISPQYIFKKKKIELKAGINIGTLIDNDTSAIYHISPKIDFRFHPIEGTLTIFAGADGGIKPYYLKNTLAKNQYTNYSYLHSPSEESIKLYGGFMGNILSNFSYLADIEYTVLQNEAFFFLTQGNFPTTKFVNNLFDIEYGDLNILSLGANLNYSSRKIKANLKGNYYFNSSKNIDIFSHQPDFVIALNSNFEVTNKISATLGANINGPMDVKYVVIDFSPMTIGSPDSANKTISKIELPLAIDINLGVNYSYTKKLNFFAQANNLLNQNYELWHGYNQPGLLIMLGASYTF